MKLDVVVREDKSIVVSHGVKAGTYETIVGEITVPPGGENGVDWVFSPNPAADNAYAPDFTKMFDHPLMWTTFDTRPPLIVVDGRKFAAEVRKQAKNKATKSKKRSRT